MQSPTELPIAVIGGGPIGLAAAAHLVARGVPVKLYEAGSGIAANVRDWGHVRLFSPWRYNIDEADGSAADDSNGEFGSRLHSFSPSFIPE